MKAEPQSRVAGRVDSATTTSTPLTRRRAFQRLGALGAWLAFRPLTGLGATAAVGQPSGRALRPGHARRAITELVFQTPMVDTHEHLPDESVRLAGAGTPGIPCDDWALLFSHYLNSDLLVAGMPQADLDRFLSPQLEARAKWKLLEPFWPAVRNTGYAQAVRLAIRELYGVDELSAATIGRVQAGYERQRRTGFYRHILQELGRIESCQVNSLEGGPFRETAMPSLLLQDISIVGFFSVGGLRANVREYAAPTGLEVRTLADWHRVIDWWFTRYGPYAVAVKSQQAYARDIDYARVPAEPAEALFARLLQGERLSAEERKRLEDHLFWYAVDQATRHGLPVKLHTGYYAGQNSMPLERLLHNAGSATDLCRLSPETRFVFLHIGYPHYEAMLALAKHYANATIDMCWAWIVNPLAAKDYLKKHLVTAPANKVLPFGGDYRPVEPVLGHAMLVRRGIAQALAELVDEGWLSLADALALVDPILRGNARRLFGLPEKLERLKTVPWQR